MSQLSWGSDKLEILLRTTVTEDKIFLPAHCVRSHVCCKSYALGLLARQGLTSQKKEHCSHCFGCVPETGKRDWDLRNNFLRSERTFSLLNEEQSGKTHFSLWIISESAFFCVSDNVQVFSHPWRFRTTAIVDRESIFYSAVASEVRHWELTHTKGSQRTLIFRVTPTRVSRINKWWRMKTKNR